MTVDLGTYRGWTLSAVFDREGWEEESVPAFVELVSKQSDITPDHE